MTVRRFRHATVPLVALSLLMLAVGAAVQPASALAASQPPECRYDDVPTDHTAYKQWRMTLLDTIYKVGSSYQPSKLVSVDVAGIGGSGKVRQLVIDDLAALASAAREAGNPLRVVSAHRSYSQQAALYQREVRNKGVAAARLAVARPGHSEHQLGTTIDFGSPSSSKPWQYNDWAQTPAGHWLKQNGWRFGFVMSYPKGDRSVTCYKYEPWHWRYVGREMAADMHGTGLTLREYLWQSFH